MHLVCGTCREEEDGELLVAMADLEVGGHGDGPAGGGDGGARAVGDGDGGGDAVDGDGEAHLPRGALAFAGWDGRGRELPYRRLQALGDVVRPRALREVRGGGFVRGWQLSHLVERGHNERADGHGVVPGDLPRERRGGRDGQQRDRGQDGRRGEQRAARNDMAARARSGESWNEFENLKVGVRGFYLRLADSGERRPWNTDYNGYNAVGAGDFATPGTAPGEASSTAGGFLTLGGLKQRARAMAGDAGRALRTLAAVVADGAGRAMAGVKGLREARRDRRVRWRPRFGDG